MNAVNKTREINDNIRRLGERGMEAYQEAVTTIHNMYTSTTAVKNMCRDYFIKIKQIICGKLNEASTRVSELTSSSSSALHALESLDPLSIKADIERALQETMVEQDPLLVLQKGLVLREK